MTDNRNYGLDILRCVSMTMIVISHIISHGGIINAAEGIRYDVLSILETAVYCSVDVFAMLSGYLMVSKRFQGRKLIELWFQVIFYSVVCNGILIAIHPEMLSMKTLSKTLLPVLMREYWYITSYFAMFFFIPYMNRLLHSEYAVPFLITVIMIFSFIPMVVMQDPFYTGYGYSPLWLGVCYLIGGYIRLHPSGEKAHRYGIGYLVVVACVSISKIVLRCIAERTGLPASIGYYFISYTSPFILLEAVFLLKAFSKITVKNSWAKDAFSFLSAGALTVYLVHEAYLVRQLYITDRFVGFNQMNLSLEIVCVVVVSIAVFLFVAAIDSFRRKLFSLLRINQTAEKIYIFGEKIYRIMEKYLQIYK